MMLMTDSLKVALLTDHIPLCDVSKKVTEENITACLNIIIHDFQEKLKINNPKILVCGLNPHAGENGYLGLEEKRYYSNLRKVSKKWVSHYWPYWCGCCVYRTISKTSRCYFSDVS